MIVLKNITDSKCYYLDIDRGKLIFTNFENEVSGLVLYKKKLFFLSIWIDEIKKTWIFQIYNRKFDLLNKDLKIFYEVKFVCFYIKITINDVLVYSKRVQLGIKEYFELISSSYMDEENDKMSFLDAIDFVNDLKNKLTDIPEEELNKKISLSLDIIQKNNKDINLKKLLFLNLMNPIAQICNPFPQSIKNEPPDCADLQSVPTK